MQPGQPDPRKFIPPATPFGFIDRPRLVDPLRATPAARLVIVHAPAGHGKTSLLASLSEQWAGLRPSMAGPLAWYSLEPSDDDSAVFIEGLVQSVRMIVPGVGKSTLATLRGVSDARAEVGRLVAVLGNELREAGIRAVYLALDDFQHITDSAIHETIEQLLKDAASPFRWIVATETEPAYYLSTLRTQDALVELGEDELRFTPAEVAWLIAARGPARLQNGATESVVNQTRGWPSAASVASAIVVRTGSPLPFTRPAPTEHAYGQLLNEALAGLPAAVRQGLLRSSLLKVVDASELRSYAGVAEAEPVLTAVEQLALPAARTGDRSGALVYDPVLRAALERELVSTLPPHELREIQKRIASHYAEIGLRDQALRGFLQGWTHEEAAELVDASAPAELALGHLDTVLRWLKAIPNVTRKGRPRLMSHEARALLARGQTHDARVLLATVEQQLRAQGDQQGLGLRASAWCALLLAEGKHEEAVKAARNALELLAEDDYAERAEASRLLARALEMLGDLGSSLAAASDGLSMAERSGHQALVVAALAQIAELTELMGEYTTALAMSNRAVERASILGTEDLAVVASGAVAASSFLARGQIEEAARIGSRMQVAAERLMDAAGDVRARLVLARVQDLMRSDGVEDAAAKLAALAARTRSAQMERVLALQWAAAALLRRGKRSDGAAMARQAQEIATGLGHRPSVLRGQVLLGGGDAVGRGTSDTLAASEMAHWLSAVHRLAAERHSHLGIWWRAKRALRDSLQIAAREGCVGMPLGLPSDAEGLFELAVRRDVLPEAAGTLLGVRVERGRRLLEPFLRSKSSDVRARAEVAAKGLEAGIGRFPRPRLVWAGLEDEASSPPVALRVLGGIDPFVGEEQAEWPSDDARNLVAYFVVHRSVAMPRLTVLRDLWGDVPESESSVRLHVGLSQIRQALGGGFPQIDLTRESQAEYIWDGAGCYIDVEHFRSVMRALQESLQSEHPPVLSDPTVRLLEEAVETYQGEFLANLDFSWCVEQREELRSHLLETTRLLIDHYMALKQWRDAIKHGLKSLKSDPMQEDVVRDLMLCYFRIGDRANVTWQYREVKRVLARERGAWPSDETRQLRIKLLGR